MVEDQGEEKSVVECSHCPSCGSELRIEMIQGDVATNHEHYKCSACGLGWVATFQHGHEGLLLHIVPEQ